MNKWSVALGCLVMTSVVFAASPPALINYQGVLRDAADAPLDGDFDMVFRFWSAEAAGDEILLDRHLSANLQAVTVTGGLLSVAIGSGEVLDGSGPGTYTTLSEVFRDHGDVWLEVQIGGETLSPRLAVAAAGYALNSSHLEGWSAGHFLDTSSTTQTKTGNLIVDGSGLGGFGIEASGGESGGYFESAADNAHVYVGHDRSGGYGIWAEGTATGGFFREIIGSGYAYAGWNDHGIAASGNDGGGVFTDTDDSGYAFVGYGNRGIEGFGTSGGGYFEDLDGTGYAYVGLGNNGIQGYGDGAGGYFEDPNATGWARVGSSSSKITGNGSVSFVQNHPDEPGNVIVYFAPEASEVAVYTRGSGRLTGGRGVVELDPTFEWVANPDLGLTAHLTPRDHAVPLAVESLSTTELVIEGPDDVAFDYIVYGLRIGFEESSVVRPKDRDAKIPSMNDHRELYARDASMRAYNALERFKDIEAEAHGRAELDLSRSQDLLARIGEFEPKTAARAEDPESDETEQHLEGSGVRPDHPAAAGSRTEDERDESFGDGDQRETDSLDVTSVSLTTPSVPPSAATLPLGVPAVAGDVLALDPDRPGRVKPCAVMADPAVVGVAVGTGENIGMESGLHAAVATSGIVTVKVDAGFGAIRPGDLLVASPTPGHAMRAIEIAPGTLLGKALEPLDIGTGTIRALVTLR